MTGSRVVHRIWGTVAHRSLEMPLGKYHSKNVGNVKGSETLNSGTGNP